MRGRLREAAAAGERARSHCWTTWARRRRIARRPSSQQLGPGGGRAGPPPRRGRHIQAGAADERGRRLEGQRASPTVVTSLHRPASSASSTGGTRGGGPGRAGRARGARRGGAAGGAAGPPRCAPRSPPGGPARPPRSARSASWSRASAARRSPPHLVRRSWPRARGAGAGSGQRWRTARVGAGPRGDAGRGQRAELQYLPVILIRAEVALAAAQGDPRARRRRQRALACGRATWGTSALSSWQGQAYLVQARSPALALGRQSEAQSRGRARGTWPPRWDPISRLTREARQLAALWLGTLTFVLVAARPKCVSASPSPLPF